MSLIFKNASQPKFINQGSKDLELTGNEMSPDHEIEEQESMIINCQYNNDISPGIGNKFSTVANSNQHVSQQDILQTQGSEKAVTP